MARACGQRVEPALRPVAAAACRIGGEQVRVMRVDADRKPALGPGRQHGCRACDLRVVFGGENHQRARRPCRRARSTTACRSATNSSPAIWQ